MKECAIKEWEDKEKTIKEIMWIMGCDRPLAIRFYKKTRMTLKEVAGGP